MNALVGNRRRVRDGLAYILFLEIGVLGHDLRGRHAVGDEIDHRGDRDPQPAHRSAAGKYVRIVRDAVKSLHKSPVRKE